VSSSELLFLGLFSALLLLLPVFFGGLLAFGGLLTFGGLL
jgi:hypothetical protein